MTTADQFSLRGSYSKGNYAANVKHLLDETESNIKFVELGQVMLGQAKLSLTSLDLKN